MEAIKKVTINKAKLNKALDKLELKIDKSNNSFDYIRLVEKQSKLRRVNTVTNKILFNIAKLNLNGLEIALKKALIKGLNETKLSNIKMYFQLANDLNIDKKELLRNDSILVKEVR